MNDELKRKLLMVLADRLKIKITSIDIREYLTENDKKTTAIKYGNWNDFLQFSSSYKYMGDKTL